MFSDFYNSILKVKRVGGDALLQNISRFKHWLRSKWCFVPFYTSYVLFFYVPIFDVWIGNKLFLLNYHISDSGHFYLFMYLININPNVWIGAKMREQLRIKKYGRSNFKQTDSTNNFIFSIRTHPALEVNSDLLHCHLWNQLQTSRNNVEPTKVRRARLRTRKLYALQFPQ